MRAPPARRPTPRAGASSLDHHRGRLDDGRGRHAAREPETLRRLARNHRHEPTALRHVKLNLGEQAFDLHFPDNAFEPVPRAERPVILAAHPLDLPGRDDAAVCGITLDADPPLPVPAPERVETDPKSSSGLPCGVRACHEAAPYCICIT